MAEILYQVTPPSWVERIGIPASVHKTLNNEFERQQSMARIADKSSSGNLQFSGPLAPTELMTGDFIKGQLLSTKERLMSQGDKKKLQNETDNASYKQEGNLTSAELQRRDSRRNTKLSVSSSVNGLDIMSRGGESLVSSISKTISLNTENIPMLLEGPTSWPPHIQAKHPDFSAKNLSPLMLYYYDGIFNCVPIASSETAPNHILLDTDVPNENVLECAKRELKRFLTCQGGQHKEFMVNGDLFSAFFKRSISGGSVSESGTAASTTDSSNWSSGARPKEISKAGQRGWCNAAPAENGSYTSSYGSSYALSSYSTTSSNILSADKKILKHSAVVQPSYLPAIQEQRHSLEDDKSYSTCSSLSSPQLNKMVCPKCKGKGYLIESKEAKWCSCGDKQHSIPSMPGSNTSALKRGSVPVRNGGGCCNQQKHVMSVDDNGSSVSESEVSEESVSTTSDQSNGTRSATVQTIVEKTEREKDYGYQVRRAFFDANIADSVAENNRYAFCPSYSISYQHFPFICYETVVPTTYADFFRVKRVPVAP